MTIPAEITILGVRYRRRWNGWERTFPTSQTWEEIGENPFLEEIDAMRQRIARLEQPGPRISDLPSGTAIRSTLTGVEAILLGDAAPNERRIGITKDPTGGENAGREYPIKRHLLDEWWERLPVVEAEVVEAEAEDPDPVPTEPGNPVLAVGSGRWRRDPAGSGRWQIYYEGNWTGTTQQIGDLLDAYDRERNRFGGFRWAGPAEPAQAGRPSGGVWLQVKEADQERRIRERDEEIRRLGERVEHFRSQNEKVRAERDQLAEAQRRLKKASRSKDQLITYLQKYEDSLKSMQGELDRRAEEIRILRADNAAEGRIIERQAEQIRDLLGQDRVRPGDEGSVPQPGPPEANLGCATTEELLREIVSRLTVYGESAMVGQAGTTRGRCREAAILALHDLPDSALRYRAVDS